jgi:hypothetical protein
MRAVAAGDISRRADEQRAPHSITSPARLSRLGERLGRFEIDYQLELARLKQADRRGSRL